MTRRPQVQFTEEYIRDHCRRNNKPLPRELRRAEVPEQKGVAVPVGEKAPAERFSTVLRASVPVPPSVNNLYWTDKQGNRRMTSMGIKFKTHAVKEIQSCALVQGFRCPAGSAIKISARLTFARAGRDLDNTCKILIDSIAKALGFNDSRVREIHMYKVEGLAGESGCSVEVELI